MGGGGLRMSKKEIKRMGKGIIDRSKKGACPGNRQTLKSVPMTIKQIVEEALHLLGRSKVSFLCI